MEYQFIAFNSTVFFWSVVFVLFTAHAFGDYVLQTPFISEYKDSSVLVMLIHCSLYTLGILLGFYFLEQAGFMFLIKGDFVYIGQVIFITHVFIDSMKCLYRIWIYKHDNLNLQSNNTNIWNKDKLDRWDRVGYYIDQFLHFAVLYYLYNHLLYIHYGW